MIKERAVNRVILIVLDSLGIGALPDAAAYGDEGSDTFSHIHEYFVNKLGRKLEIPNLTKMGFGNIKDQNGKVIAGGAYVCDDPQGSYGRAKEASLGKDTLTGHWEITGLKTETAFKTYPDGFPEEFMRKFEDAIGRETIGNKAASGTVIIEELGPEHEKTGKPIVYTSSDSVFQIAAYVEKIPLGELYEICETARKLLYEELPCARVIARPYYIDSRGKRIRMPDRKDYALDPPAETLLDKMQKSGKLVYSIGKIKDIFNKRGITYMSPNPENDYDAMMKTLGAVDGFVPTDRGNLFTKGIPLVIANLNDFDTKYGHRRDPEGYGKAIEEFDSLLGAMFFKIKGDDILILCADHGNDPTHTGFDHTREYIPIVCYGKKVKQGYELGTRESFADIGATIAEHVGAEMTDTGSSFLEEILIGENQ